MLIEKKCFRGLSKEDVDKGIHIMLYSCPSCLNELGHTTHSNDRCFGKSTVMKENLMPDYCPYCGKEVELSNSAKEYFS